VKANEDVATSKNERSSTVVLLVGIGEEKQLSRECSDRSDDVTTTTIVLLMSATNTDDEWHACSCGMSLSHRPSIDVRYLCFEEQLINVGTTMLALVTSHRWPAHCSAMLLLFILSPTWLLLCP